jgi:trimethylamine---corrinoid protein Co-methyltransferase
MKSNYQVNDTPQFKVLSPDQVQEIHYATLEILERTGVIVLEKEAQHLLMDAGARTDNKSRFWIPSPLVESAIRTAPKRVTLCGRDGSRNVTLEGNKTFFGTGSDCPNILDSFTGKRRPMKQEDIAQAARLCDYLPNIDFFMSVGLMSDVPWDIYDKLQFETMMLNTKKPIVFTATDRSGMEGIFKMASLVAGGEENLKRNPFICLYAEPVSPLKHVETALRKLLFAAENDIPALYTTGGMAGATLPVTLAGAIAVSNAEILCGLVIHQMKKPGAPFISGGVLSLMDMQTTNFSYGAPEFFLMSAGMADLCHFYGLPIYSTAGCSDAKVLDQQAAVEASLSCMVTALSGANLIHDIGYLESGMTGSFEMIVLTNEILNMVKRIMRGIPVTQETLALDTIDRVGPGGEYISDEHTYLNFKKEFWFPQLMNRQRYDSWVTDGSKTLGDRLNGEVKRILGEHKPDPVPEKLVKEIHSIASEKV